MSTRRATTPPVAAPLRGLVTRAHDHTRRMSPLAFARAACLLPIFALAACTAARVAAPAPCARTLSTLPGLNGAAPADWYTLTTFQPDSSLEDPLQVR